jgi:hypothetical protein
MQIKIIAHSIRVIFNPIPRAMVNKAIVPWIRRLRCPLNAAFSPFTAFFTEDKKCVFCIKNPAGAGFKG